MNSKTCILVTLCFGAHGARCPVGTAHAPSSTPPGHDCTLAAGLGYDLCGNLVRGAGQVVTDHGGARAVRCGSILLEVLISFIYNIFRFFHPVTRDSARAIRITIRFRTYPGLDSAHVCGSVRSTVVFRIHGSSTARHALKSRVRVGLKTARATVHRGIANSKLPSQRLSLIHI